MSHGNNTMPYTGEGTIGRQLDESDIVRLSAADRTKAHRQADGKVVTRTEDSRLNAQTAVPPACRTSPLPAGRQAAKGLVTSSKHDEAEEARMQQEQPFLKRVDTDEAYERIGDVTGLGQKKPGMTDRMLGTAEKAVGKVTGNSHLQAKGFERKTGINDID